MCGAVTGPLCPAAAPRSRPLPVGTLGTRTPRLVRRHGARPGHPEPPRPLLPGRDPDPGTGAHPRVRDPLARLEPDRLRRIEDVDAVLLAPDAEQGAQPGGAAGELGVAAP